MNNKLQFNDDFKKIIDGLIERGNETHLKNITIFHFVDEIISHSDSVKTLLDNIENLDQESFYSIIKEKRKENSKFRSENSNETITHDEEVKFFLMQAFMIASINRRKKARCFFNFKNPKKIQIFSHSLSIWCNYFSHSYWLGW